MAEICPQCGHQLDKHNDAGTMRGGQGQMCCYGPPSGPGPHNQFLPSGEPNICGCSYSGQGTTCFGSTEPTQAQIYLRDYSLL